MRTARDNLRFFEDFARMATGALGSFTELRAQLKALVKERMDQVLAEMDMVTREEFDRVEAMAAKARARQEALEKRVAALERALKKKKK
jgi:BMFP domain-containing protein YqiC